LAGRTWYVASNAERRHYLTLLGRALQYSDWKCLAYCVMHNRIELAMIAGERPLDSWAKRANAPFAQWLNKRREQLGPVFADRPTTVEVAPSQALAVIANIHNLPVRADIVSRAADSSWTSHRAYLGVDAAPCWLDVDDGLRIAGFGASAAGLDAAVDELATQAPIVLVRTQPSLSRIAPAAFTSDAVVRAVAERYRVSSEALSQRYARGPVGEAKLAAVHVARQLGVPLAQIASKLRVSRQRASHIAMTALPDEGRAFVNDVVRALREHPKTAEHAESDG